jgi:hypothetical protein
LSPSSLPKHRFSMLWSFPSPSLSLYSPEHWVHNRVHKET